ncbi:MAG: FtsW/RodA/SpoVE family cell cycle protein [Rhodothermaceae bacterium]|nr:FtsW/RodA/SpoVE family cell cycle protein [Rhodothermaceae bacterium]
MFIASPNHKTSYILESSSEMAGMRQSDRWLIALVVLLMVGGMLAVYSSIAYFAEMKNTTAASLVFGHLMKVGISFIVLVIFSKIDYHIVARLARIGVILSWIFLTVVTLYGNEVFGARRYLSIGGLSFQPSSFATVALLILVVVLVVEKKDYIKSFTRAFLPTLTWISVTCLLIGLEDFSSAAVLFGLSLIIMFIGRASVVQLAALVVVGVVGAGFLLSQSLERQSRINNYVEQVVQIKSDEFVLGAGYQAQQAHIAIARGGTFGVGIGKSTQRDFLPAPYNDFIYAIIAEEYGLLGAGFILLVFMGILIRGIVFIARKAPDELGMLIAVACTLTVVIYGFVNAAVACGLFPVTGLPMPFVSYGGTSMLFSGAMIGILLNISKQAVEIE